MGSGKFMLGAGEPRCCCMTPSGMGDPGRPCWPSFGVRPFMSVGFGEGPARLPEGDMAGGNWPPAAPCWWGPVMLSCSCRAMSKRFLFCCSRSMSCIW